MGGTHPEADLSQEIIDPKYRLGTSLCYMLDAHILEIANATQNIVNELIKLM